VLAGENQYHGEVPIMIDGYWDWDEEFKTFQVAELLSIIMNMRADVNY